MRVACEPGGASLMPWPAGDEGRVRGAATRHDAFRNRSDLPA